MLSKIHQFFTQNNEIAISHSVDITNDLIAINSADISIKLHEFIFSKFYTNIRQNALFAYSECEKVFLKIQLNNLHSKQNSAYEEGSIIQNLNKLGSVTAPTFIARGQISPKTFPFEKLNIETTISQDLQYIITENIITAESIPIADILLAILEQQKLGFFQGDIKNSNLRFDTTLQRCVFIDYDQTLILNDSISKLSPKDFLYWALQQTFKDGTPRIKINQLYNINFLDTFYEDNSLKLEHTSLYQEQHTTNSSTGIYHSFDTNEIFVQGSRAIGQREYWLNEVIIKENEKILDVGCNGGLLSFYMHDRNACVTGIDIDPCIITSCKILANIFHKNIIFYNMNLDDLEVMEKYDTILLFSVIHHTKKMKRNCKIISDSCNRVLIECRLHEQGKMFDGENWIETSQWQYESLEDLKAGLENLFPSLKIIRYFGPGDKKRYLFELIKK